MLEPLLGIWRQPHRRLHTHTIHYPISQQRRQNCANDGDLCKVSQPLILVCAFSMPGMSVGGDGGGA
jgi:hypothetical protein